MNEVQLVVQEIGGVTIANFGSSSILEAAVVDALGRQLLDLVENRARRKMLLDFSRVRFLSSTMLGVLLHMRKQLAAIKGRMVICGLRPELRRVFKISKLEKLFEFYDKEEQALNSFGVYTQP